MMVCQGLRAADGTWGARPIWRQRGIPPGDMGVYRYLPKFRSGFVDIFPPRRADLTY